MKKVFLFLLTFVAMVAEAQTKGNFEVLDLGSFKLHVYNTNDALGDASYIIEGKTGLVTLEQPLFKDNVSEFDTYVVSLNKPVQKIITNYHVGGTGNHNVVMIEGMPDFVKGAVYGGMMQNFAKIFGDAITANIVFFPNNITCVIVQIDRLVTIGKLLKPDSYRLLQFSLLFLLRHTYVFILLPMANIDIFFVTQCYSSNKLVTK